MHLAQSLTVLFQLFITQGLFPSTWKSSFIISLQKKGRKDDISNYRPIEIQHGFLKGRSTTTNLTEFVSSTFYALESGHEVDVIATDFGKAFDRISHDIILLQLKALGFQINFITWIQSYLNERQYYVLFRSMVSLVSPKAAILVPYYLLWPLMILIAPLKIHTRVV